jgi:hypothetical protein
MNLNRRAYCFAAQAIKFIYVAVSRTHVFLCALCVFAVRLCRMPARHGGRGPFQMDRCKRQGALLRYRAAGHEVAEARPQDQFHRGAARSFQIFSRTFHHYRIGAARAPSQRELVRLLQKGRRLPAFARHAVRGTGRGEVVPGKTRIRCAQRSRRAHHPGRRPAHGRLRPGDAGNVAQRGRFVETNKMTVSGAGKDPELQQSFLTGRAFFCRMHVWRKLL